MTTDPRIIECAKALLTGLYPNCYTDDPAFVDTFTDAATACVLTWLEQDFTDSEWTAFNADIGFIVPLDRLRTAYRRMCAQAKKEIGG